MTIKSSVDRTTAYAKSVVAGIIVAGPQVRAACARHLADQKKAKARGLIWDLSAANRAIEFFPAVLTVEVEAPNDYGEMESRAEPFHLQDWQAFIIGALFGWKKANGLRRFRRAYIEIGKGNGKALAINTPIPTPSGWSNMGDLRPGDMVFDETGSPCNVISVSGLMHGRPCYRIRFSDGAEIIADAEHVWCVASLRSGGKKGPKPADEPRKGGYSLKTTIEIAASLTIGKTTSLHPQAKWNHRIDVSGALQLPPADLQIPPYTLGAWLGDGNSDDARLTVARRDWEIVERIREDGVSVDERKENTKGIARVILGSGGRSQGARNDSLQALLRKHGLLGNKHIPPAYFRASFDQRLALLQGLMDTDGSALKNGAAEFCSTSKDLACDVRHLLLTLGYKPTMTETDAVLDGRTIGRRWRILFHPYADIPVFGLARKTKRQKPRPPTRPISSGRMIIACEPIDSVLVQCISVDSRSHLFLAGENYIPTHNSPLAAGIGHYMLAACGKLRAEVYSAATDIDQASILFRDAVAMMERSPALSHRLATSGINPVWQLTHKKSGSFFKPISSEKKGKSGIRPFCALIDEIHEHRDNSVIEMLRAGTKGNQEALQVEITNSGFDKKSVCGIEHDYAVKIADGSIGNDAFFSFICSLDEGDDPFENESCWIKANPNLDVSIHYPFIREQVEEAKGMPSKEGIVRRLHFCQWTDAESAAIPRKVWAACQKEVDVYELAASGARCFGGLDLSRARDLTAFTLVWILEGGADKERFATKTWFWTPKDTLRDRARSDRAPYEQWVKEKHLEAIEGNRINYGWVANRLAQICAEFNPEVIGCDQYGLERLRDHFDDLGVAPPCVVHPQGFNRRKVDEIDDAPDGAEAVTLWMPDSINKLEAALYDQRIEVDPNPVMTMCAASVIYKRNATDHRMFDKEKASNRIDGMVSLAMGIGVATLTAGSEGSMNDFFGSFAP